MEQNQSLLKELKDKEVIIKTHGGVGTKITMPAGDYKGILLDYDDKFIKLEYEISKFVGGNNIITKAILLINFEYIMTVEEYQGKE